MTESVAYKLGEERTRQTHDGILFDCPECNREQHLARAIFGGLGGERRCSCGVEFRVILEVNRND